MKLHNIFLAFGLAVMLTACSDDFLENTPQGSLSDGVMNSTESIDLLVNSAYAGLSGFTNEQDDPWVRPTSNWSFGEVRADNAYKGGGGEGDLWDIHAMETFQVQSNNGNLDGKWFNLYSLISRCNAALRVLNAADPAVVKVKDSRIAEMKVLRSHFYFELVRLFNQVPYMDENLPEAEYVNVPNNEFTREKHLARIANELLEASKSLPERQSEVGRINRNIALAYAAKVKLYQAYEQNPETHAVVKVNKELLEEVVELINRVQGYRLLPDFQGLDLVANENGPESVFAIQYSMNDNSENGGRINWSNLLNSPGGNSPYHGDGFFLPSQDLINAYQTDENGLPVFDYQQKPDYGVVTFIDDDHQTLSNTEPNVDPRLDFVVGRPTITYKTYKATPCQSWVRDRGVYGHNCAKRFWVSPESSDMYQGWPWGASQLNWQIIRYADLLLYKAEALIEIGGDGLEEARTLINEVRGRAMNSKYVKDFSNPDKDAANYKIGLYPAEGWTQDYARQALRTEMRLEKALEGERFFDLVRWGIAKDVMTAYFKAEKDTRIYYQNAKFDDGEEYYPIPVAQYNFSLGKYKQNPGYPAF
ncbi:MAG: RagB/SusD family nutrient uptake outer membrane protein [Bacteroidales bacterium]|nr:RagB/SusD family nutrient uptake outer membrane protein [Bacteroidales bacterium]MCM1146548.1 RagB/SusD family nutrient uptake outer membrane protein [Bacteroidales bacterium]MCM1205940.1 RagB/SusD family nutrient uptake outer membrane protein [Bacillota bacterium]MCM1510182.1 RagB/SusD family nutrient uptake outer membrane protein [Clostridium sp.]